MNHKEIVFLVSTKQSLGILESQVFSLANYIVQNRAFAVKIVLLGEKISFDRSTYSDKLEFHFLNETISMGEIKNARIYIRSIDVFISKFLRLKINNNFIVYDFRALLFVESFSRRRSYIVATFIFMLEMIAYLLADEICCVSHNLKSQLSKIFIRKRHIYVFPCLISNMKERVRSHHSYSNETYNFVYLGSISGWQKFEEAADLYKLYSAHNDSTFTVITKDKIKAREILVKKGLNAEIKSLSNAGVLADLGNYDFGFLLRDNNLLNHVASPVKYLEYLSCGVIPIMNYGIGDYSNEAKVNNIAIVIGRNEILLKEELSNLINDKSYNTRLSQYTKRYDYSIRINTHPLVSNVLGNLSDTDLTI